jgi:hypothetical protein
MSDGSETNRAFPVTPGEWYGAAIKASTHRCYGVIYIFWRDLSGAYLGSHSGTISGTGSGSSTNPDAWPEYYVNGVAPASAAYAQVVVRKLPTISGTNSYLFMHKPYTFKSHADISASPGYSPEGVTVIHGGQVVAETIEAGHLKTDTFETAGLAIFGGALQSDDFNGAINSSGDITDNGTVGWAASKGGGMVLNDLVVREWVQIGAVSDGATYTRASTIAKDNGAVLTTQTLGPWELGQFWQIAWQIDLRPRSKSSTYYSNKGGNGYNIVVNRTRAKLQIRTKSSGTWSGWSTLATTAYAATPGTWATTEDVFSKMGSYDDVQVRIYMETASSSTTSPIDGGNSTYNNVDDVSFVAKAVVR